MVKTFGSAFTALGLIGALAACASPGANGTRSASIFGDRVDSANIGLATRAQAAMEKGETGTAIELAERAVAGSPRDAGFRALLGNAYFAAGRFASAEAAYKDSLALLPAQPQLILKLALVSIAQGKNGEAISHLESARSYLDPADYGLALALAGQPASAVSVLEHAARNIGADSRVRQNLALAHALNGNWDSARIVAAQDVPADQVNARVQQWMAFAKPATASDQVASLTGVTPAAADPGQPSRLALNLETSRTAAVDPAEIPVAPESVPVQPVAPPPVQVAYAAEPAPAPVAVEQAYAAQPAPEPVSVAAAEPAPPVARSAAAAAPMPMRKVGEAKPKGKTKTATAQPGLSPQAARMMHKASFPKVARGNSNSVVQIGAYGSRGFVGVAWSNLAKKYPALRGYMPSSARFESAKGTVYRLSVQGFASDSDARDFCSALKRAGGNCFVRSVAGDAPVRLASL